jgi:hypothetical protein
MRTSSSKDTHTLDAGASHEAAKALIELSQAPGLGAGAGVAHASFQKQQRITIHDLPPEIHLIISQQLIYPDALSLKHTCSYFFHLVDTGIKLKVDWLMERRSLHLECPNDRRCDLGSDLKFCRGSVR